MVSFALSGRHLVELVVVPAGAVGLAGLAAVLAAVAAVGLGLVAEAEVFGPVELE